MSEVRTELDRIIDEVLDQSNLLDRALTALQGKAAGGAGGDLKPVALSLIRKGVGTIDTGIDAANSNLTIEIRYEFDTMPTGYWNLVHAYVNQSTNATRILYSKAASVLCCLNSIPSESLIFSQTRYKNVTYTDTLKPENSTSFSYTTAGTKTNKARTKGTELSGKTIRLFPNSASDDGVNVKVYYLKIYDGDTLVRDFVPHVTQDGECGLYDNVTKQFYGNTTSGTFEVEMLDNAYHLNTTAQ